MPKKILADAFQGNYCFDAYRVDDTDREVEELVSWLANEVYFSTDTLADLDAIQKEAMRRWRGEDPLDELAQLDEELGL